MGFLGNPQDKILRFGIWLERRSTTADCENQYLRSARNCFDYWVNTKIWVSTSTPDSLSPHSQQTTLSTHKPMSTDTDYCKVSFGDLSWEVATDGGLPSTSVCSDISSAIANACSNPIDFPPLDQAIVAGDRVALAVDPTTPNLVEVVCGCAAWICEQGTEPTNLSIVIASNDNSLLEAIRSGLPEKLADIELGLHDVVDRIEQDEEEEGEHKHVAYLAANEAGEPVYVNRQLVDADVVIPISTARSQDEAVDYFGEFSLFPLLSDQRTTAQFHDLDRLFNQKKHQVLNEWASLAATSLGAFAGLSVIPANCLQSSSRQAHKILAGQLTELESTVQAELAKTHAKESSSDLVILLMQTNGTCHWHDIGRGLHEAARRLKPGGSVVVCSNLRQRPGPQLKRLSSTALSSAESTKKQSIASSSPILDDLLAASMIARIREDHHIYLVSELSNELVEGLGMAVLENEEQLNQLVKQVESVNIIPFS